MGKVFSKDKSGNHRNSFIQQLIRGQTQLSLPTQIQNYYVLKNSIGTGSFSRVRIANIIPSYNLKFNPNTRFAVVSASIKRQPALSIAYRKLDLLQRLDHPYVIQLIESFQDQTHLHLVTQYCKGGTLGQRIQQSRSFLEQESKQYIYNILQAIYYIHNSGVAHGDIHPDSFIFFKDKRKTDLKMCNFSRARKFTDPILDIPQDSLLYTAPEMLEGNPLPESDLWSAGILLYQMLNGKFPYKAELPQKMLEKIAVRKLLLNSRKWNQCSQKCKDLVRALLAANPSERITAQEAILHSWFLDIPSLYIYPHIIQMVAEFPNMSSFKKQLLKMMARNLDNNEIGREKQTFLAINTGRSGGITIQELQTALSAQGDLQVEVHQVFRNLQSREGCVRYIDFLSATIWGKLDLNQEVIWNLFCYFDVDNSGTVDAQKIYFAFKRVGGCYDMNEISNLLSEVNLESPIPFEDFKSIIYN